MSPSNSSGNFQREYLVRLPLPLAQLYSRAHNSPSSRARHDNSFYLFEALIKLSAAPLVGAYLAEIEAGAPRIVALDRLLAQLALPSLGQWVGILRETARHFGTRPEAVSHPLGHVWQQLNARRRSPSAALELFRRIKNGPDGQPAGDESSSLLELFDALVLYRNTVFGHGAGRSEEFYETEMGPLLFPAASDILSEGVLDLLGPRGSRLVHISELRVIDEQRVELVLSELVGLQSERMAPVELTPAEAAAVASNCVAVLWPGRKIPLRLDPLLVFRGAEFADEVRFLNRDRSGKQVEYLSYTTGKTERDKSMVPAMARLLSRVIGRSVEESELDRLAQQSLAETPAIDALLPPAAPTQRTLGDYEILAELGRGGMGVVYLARQLSLGRLVALKMLPASLSGDEMALARFRREMRALGRCEHPHIVKVLASGTLPDGQNYYAMEYVPGADLEMVWRELSGHKRLGEASTLSGLTLDEAVLTATRKQRDEVRRHSEAGKSSTAAEPEFGSPAGTEVPSLPLPPLPSLPAADEDAGGYMRRVAQLMRDAALAVQAVHDQEIVHRDIKPANLMLTPDGSRVVLMDFGLAKSQSLALTKTSSGEFLGTLRYAAPEQLAAAKVRVDLRVDVRALGTTLWELLTRQQAFGEAEDQSQLASWVLNRDLPQLRTIDPTIDRDLEAIVARAVERDPERRIQTARELAEYLDLYLRGKPLPIRTPGPVELLGRWVREHRALVATAAAACLAVLLTVVVAFLAILDSRGKAIVARNEAVDAKNDAVAARNAALDLAKENKNLADKESAARQREETARKAAEAATQREAAERKRADEKALEARDSAKRAEQERQRADAEAQAARQSAEEAIRERRLADRRLYVATMNLAQLALENGQSARVQELLARYDQPAAADDPRGWEWYYLRRLGGEQLRKLDGHAYDVQGLAVSQDGSMIASGGSAEYEPVNLPFGRNQPREEPKLKRKGMLKLWDVRRAAEIATLVEHEGLVRSLAFTPDNKRLISCEGAKLHIWDVAGRKEVPTKFAEPVQRFAMRPDGRRLAILSGKTIHVWDLENEVELKNFPAVPADLNRNFFDMKIAYSPDGTRLVAVTHLQHEEPPARGPGIPSPEDAKKMEEFFRNRKPPYLTVVWDAETGEPLTRIWGAGNYLALSPDGQRIVTGYTTEAHIVPSLIRAWDIKTGKSVLEPKEHGGSNFATAAYAPDGKSFCISDSDVIAVYDATSGAVTNRLRGHKGTIMNMCYSRDGRVLVSCDGFGAVLIWTMIQGEPFVALDIPAGDIAVHGGRSLQVTAGQRQVQVWQLGTDRKIRDIATGFTQFSKFAISPDGKRAAAQNIHYATSVLDIDEGRVLLTLEGQGEGATSATIGGPAWSRDGKWIAAPLLSIGVPAALGNPVKVWNASTGKTAYTIPDASCVAFAPDSRRVVTGGRNEPVAVWDIIAKREIFSLRLKGRDPRLEGPICVAFAPDGKTVAGGFFQGRIIVWDAATGAQLLVLDGHPNEVNRLIYTPDSRRLVSACADATIKLWDTASGMEVMTLRGHTRRVLSVAMTADGRWLLSSGGGIHVRDIGAPLAH